MCGAEPFFELSFPLLSLPKQAPLVLELAPGGARQHFLQVGQEEDVQGVRGQEEQRKGGREPRPKEDREGGIKDRRIRRQESIIFFGRCREKEKKKRGRRLFSAALVFFPDRTPAPSNLLATKRSNTIRKRQSLWELAEGRDGIGEGGRELWLGVVVKIEFLKNEEEEEEKLLLFF